MAVRAIVLLALLAPVSLGSRLKTTSSCTLVGEGITMDITSTGSNSPTSVPAATGPHTWKFSGEGTVKVSHVECPITTRGGLPPADQTITNGGASGEKDVTCAGECCIRFCCGDMADCGNLS